MMFTCNYIQRQGKIPWLSQEDSDRIILISKYGLKVTDIRKQVIYMCTVK